jgi:hypothetical protein
VEPTLTLGLDGTVRLATFAGALEKLRRLLEGLAGDGVDWLVVGLECASATATVEAVTHDDTARSRAAEAVDAVLYHARLFASEQWIEGWPGEMVAELVRLAGRGGVEEIVLQTPADEVVIAGGPDTPRPRRLATERDIGSVVGRVQTLRSRGGLRFTLYDAVWDRPVACYLRPGDEDRMREAWGRLAEVHGLVSRDPRDHRPRSVREITAITLVDDVPPGHWRAARGALAGTGDDRPAEVVIRFLRDLDVG